MAIANEKKLNFNTDEIEAEQLLDIFQDDEYLETEYVDILDFCLDLEANSVIDDDQFNYMEV
jgi:hypothetical protein|tara:strand:+ start:2398 stop:2583 length:186 start_codon:yes stop_codon:yes gene_type:complete